MTINTNDLLREISTIFREPVSNIFRQVSPYGSSFHIEELEITFAGGTTLHAVLKDLGPDNMLEDARNVKPAFLHDPRREIDVYRSILSGLKLGTARLYGALLEPATSSYWMLLENVRGALLREFDDFDIWLEAARWLARFHGSLDVAHSCSSSPYLLQQNADYYWRWLQRAHDATGSPLDAIAGNYKAVIQILTSLPQSVLHGEFYASNILVDSKGSSLRICPVDWEMAGVGPALMDLAALASGKWTRNEQSQITETYIAACVESMRPRDSQLALDCCRLQIAIQWLGWSQNWTPPPEHAHDWLRDALDIASHLQL